MTSAASMICTYIYHGFCMTRSSVGDFYRDIAQATDTGICHNIQVRHLPLRAQKGERLYAVAEIGHNTSIQAANGIDRQHFTSSLRACSNAASASQDVQNTMEWGEVQYFQNWHELRCALKTEFV